MKTLRLLHLTHPDLLPPDTLEGYSEREINVFKTDYDVVVTLRELGHEVVSLGVKDELGPIRQAVEEFKPHAVFNLLEEFAGLPELDQHVVAYLELLGVPYTGCNPRGLVLARGKALSKKLLAYHRIRVPRFNVFAIGRRVRRRGGLGFPLIVKSLVEEASMGISQASFVEDDEHLAERVAFVHEQIGTDAIAEQYIDGRELYSAVLGNDRRTVLPTFELLFGSLPPGALPIATEKLKHDVGYQERRGIGIRPAADLPAGLERRIGQITRRICRILDLDGYARIDFRLDADGRLWFLEANPNPEVAEHEEFAAAAEAGGLPYPRLLQRIVNLALRRANKG